MKLKIPFYDIKLAIEEASYENHYFIDKKNHKIILISEYEDNYREKLEKTESDDFIGIPIRMPQDDFNIMESFVWQIRDIDTARKFKDVLNKGKPFRNFKELINQHPQLREKWFKHRDKQIENEAMNWLCENNIELEDKSFMPVVEIKELKAEEVKLPKEFDTFGPIDCMNCNNKEGIKTRWFEVNISNDNMLIDREIKRTMKEKYGIEDYGCMTGGDKDILTYSECPKCKSSDIFEDF